MEKKPYKPPFQKPTLPSNYKKYISGILFGSWKDLTDWQKFYRIVMGVVCARIIFPFVNEMTGGAFSGLLGIIMFIVLFLALPVFLIGGIIYFWKERD